MSTNRPHWSSFCVIFYNSSKDCINFKKKNKRDYEIYLNIVLCNRDRKTMSDVCTHAYHKALYETKTQKPVGVNFKSLGEALRIVLSV